jgi:four helix bundle protein
MAHKIEELPIYPKVIEFWVAVNALLAKPALRGDRDLHGQISRANSSIPSNMVEGFEQSTDRAFANFLTHSKGSVAEVVYGCNKPISSTTSARRNSSPFRSPPRPWAKCWEDSSSTYAGATGAIGAHTRTTTRHHTLTNDGSTNVIRDSDPGFTIRDSRLVIPDQ